MSLRVALHHKTSYRYDRLVSLSPHEVRLRPAPHTRTPVLSYSLRVTPAEHFVNWQQDPYGNYLGRFVFQEKTDALEFCVDLVVDMAVINPFDFFVENYAQHFPFSYPAQLKNELGAYLKAGESGPLLAKWLAKAHDNVLHNGMLTNEFLVAVNQRVQKDIAYVVRLEPGVQTPEETLQKESGSCRDSAWLLVTIFRELDLAARFVSGYLIQLSPDLPEAGNALGEKMAEPVKADFTDLHAWAEVYIPGAGWIGLDPTSGMLAGEGHIPLACSALPQSAAPITGFADEADVTFSHEMTVTRIHEDPRVTQPYTEEEWQKIDHLGQQIDHDLKKYDVRLTQGGEPTFVSIDDMNSDEWNTLAHGEKKRELSGQLLHRLKHHFAPGGLIQYGQGKWYPGEPLPRWALTVFWRADGQPLWSDASLFSDDNQSDNCTHEKSALFMMELVKTLNLPAASRIPAYEDIFLHLQREQKLPVNVDPLKYNLNSAGDRSDLASLLTRGLGNVVGYVLPLKAEEYQPGTPAKTRWLTSAWPLKSDHLYLVEGDSPMGLRLPLDSLPEVLPEDQPLEFDVDPFSPQSQLRAHAKTSNKTDKTIIDELDPNPDPVDVVRTALCVEVRDGRLHVFMPPLKQIDDFLALTSSIEQVAARLTLKIRMEGYPPPRDPRIKSFSITPDPGVIEVNIHPAASWNELVYNVTTLYQEARLTRLGTEKFMLDGRHTGTGGGNHATLGGATPEDSPMLRRPDLLKSLITYWQNHPALSYLFSGSFIGATSQAPRIDEALNDNLYELAIAFQQMDRLFPNKQISKKPWMIDRLLRNLLTDITGNTHRSEFSIDKLYSPDGPTGRLGLVEFRAFEMPPHERMSLVQMVLLRALVARFWQTPYQAGLVHWGTSLHDKWMLPHFITQDIGDIVKDCRADGYAFEEHWFNPFVEFRFPRYGTVNYEGIEMELRQAIEPWNVLGEEMSTGRTARYVDSSVERLQLRIKGMTGERYIVACNGRMVPLHPTGIPGEYVAGIRFRAWSPWSALHPTIKVHAPLTFDLVDTWSKRAIGGCTYHVSHPGGRSETIAPVNANAAEARRLARFWAHGHTPGTMQVKREALNPCFPMTLDLRWQENP